MRPVVFEAIVEHVFEFVYEHCRRCLEACGEHLLVFAVGDDFAGQRGLLLAPKVWRQIFKPRYARLFELGKRYGKYVQMHSCGNISAVLPDLVDSGLDIWQTVQLHTLPMTPEQLKQRFGRNLTFFGGINTQRLAFQAPAQVRNEVQRCITALGRQGGYIVSPDHMLKLDVPLDNIIALYETAREFRAPGYTL